MVEIDEYLSLALDGKFPGMEYLHEVLLPLTWE
jgi:hypothetical protein